MTGLSLKGYNLCRCPHTLTRSWHVWEPPRCAGVQFSCGPALPVRTWGLWGMVLVLLEEPGLRKMPGAECPTLAAVRQKSSWFWSVLQLLFVGSVCVF